MDECRHRHWCRWPSLAVFSQCKRRISYGTLERSCLLDFPYNDRVQSKIKWENLTKFLTSKKLLQLFFVNNITKMTLIKLINLLELHHPCEWALNERCISVSILCSMAMTLSCDEYEMEL